MASILIILVNWNGKKDTLECLESLKAVSSPRFTTVVVDNGSSDDSVARIREKFPDVPVFETGKNLGFAGGNNVAISWGLKKNFDWFLLLNNDTVVSPDFLDAFLKAAENKPNGKIFGAKIYCYDKKDTIDHLGGIWDPSIGELRSKASGKIDDGVSFDTMQPVDYVCGAALFMHKSVPMEIGLLEDKFFLFWEETDFCFRAKRAGFEVWTAPKAKIWHKISSSFTGGKPQMHYFWWRSRLLFIERNFLQKDKTLLYRKVIFPDLFKLIRHYALFSLRRLSFKSKNKQKALRNKAGLLGVFHYAIGKFGTSPRSLSTKSPL